MLFFSPLNRLAKVNSALIIGILLLISTSLGLLGPRNITMTMLGFDITILLKDIFSKWWYLGLEILLAISLLSCSFLDQLFVMKCHINITNKLKRVKIRLPNHFSRESTTLSQLKERLSKITGSKTNVLQKGVLRYWTPLGVHLLAVAILTYGALDVLYTFRESGSFMVSNGLFVSWSGSPQTSFIHPRSTTYCRINDLWALEDPYQPFMDVSILDMSGEEMHRFTLTSSSNSLPVDRNVGGRLSLGSLVPRRVRLTNQETYWELPALPLSKGQPTSGWIASGTQGELFTGWGGGQMILSANFDMDSTWDQQDFSEEFMFSASSSRLVDVLYEASVTWLNNDLSINVFLVPLVAVLVSLLVAPLDVLLDYKPDNRQ